MSQPRLAFGFLLTRIATLFWIESFLLNREGNVFWVLFCYVNIKSVPHFFSLVLNGVQNVPSIVFQSQHFREMEFKHTYEGFTLSTIQAQNCRLALRSQSKGGVVDRAGIWPRHGMLGQGSSVIARADADLHRGRSLQELWSHTGLDRGFWITIPSQSFWRIK